MSPKKRWTGWMLGLFMVGPVWAEAPGDKAFVGAPWREVFQGVEEAAVNLTLPRPVKAHLLRIHLGVPGVTIIATPGNGSAAGETTGERTSRFMKRMKCQAAVNAGPFDVVSGWEGKALNLNGLHISGGKLVSPDNGFPVLLFDTTGTARIQRHPSLNKIKEAVSGFQVILWKGQTIGTDIQLHPRTAAGVSPDGKTLWLLVVDGRQQAVSEGCTTPEMAKWLRAMGASTALNLDGGGTSTMVIEGAEGQPVILNRPIHGGIPGWERPAGSHLGIQARALRAK